jgi:hypothetical protein
MIPAWLALVVKVLQHLFAGLIQLLHEAVWPLFVGGIVFLFRDSIREALKNRTVSVRFGSWEVVLALMEERGQITAPERKLLSEHLSSSDVWALQTIMDGDKKPEFAETDKMNGVLKVAARTLIELNLVAVVTEAGIRKVVVTEKGRQILAAAKSISL